jgi:hypothetical protein
MLRPYALQYRDIPAYEQGYPDIWMESMGAKIRAQIGELRIQQKIRHCERSEASQGRKQDWIASSLRSSQ